MGGCGRSCDLVPRQTLRNRCADIRGCCRSCASVVLQVGDVLTKCSAVVLKAGKVSMSRRAIRCCRGWLTAASSKQPAASSKGQRSNQALLAGYPSLAAAWQHNRPSLTLKVGDDTLTRVLCCCSLAPALSHPTRRRVSMRRRGMGSGRTTTGRPSCLTVRTRFVCGGVAVVWHTQHVGSSWGRTIKPRTRGNTPPLFYSV